MRRAFLVAGPTIFSKTNVEGTDVSIASRSDCSGL